MTFRDDYPEAVVHALDELGVTPSGKHLADLMGLYVAGQESEQLSGEALDHLVGQIVGTVEALGERHTSREMKRQAVKGLLSKPEPPLSEDADALLHSMVLRERRELSDQIRTQRSLSEPCPPGHWRWADTDTSGYRKLSEPELAEKRRKAAERLVVAERKLAALDYMVTYFNNALGADRWIA